MENFCKSSPSSSVWSLLFQAVTYHHPPPSPNPSTHGRMNNKDFIDWRYIHSWLVFSTQLVNCCFHGRRNNTCVLLRHVAPLPSLWPPPLPKLNVVYTDSVWLWGGGGVELCCRPYSAGVLHPVSDQVQNLQNCFTTQNKNDQKRRHLGVGVFKVPSFMPPPNWSAVYVLTCTYTWYSCPEDNGISLSRDEMLRVLCTTSCESQILVFEPCNSSAEQLPKATSTAEGRNSRQIGGGGGATAAKGGYDNNSKMDGVGV